MCWNESDYVLENKFFFIQTAAPFSIDGANVTSGSSLCGTGTNAAILSLSLFPSNEPLRINFRRELDLQTVYMSVVLNLDPTKHFENASGILPFELENSYDLPIGLTNSSYKCSSEEQMFFNQDPGFSMTMKITNLQVQAYNVVDGKYGEGKTFKVLESHRYSVHVFFLLQIQF